MNYKFIFAAALAFPALAAAAWHILDPLGKDDSVSQILSKIGGYQQLEPPSLFFGPGTIVAVESQPNRSVQLRLVCTIATETLEPLWKISTTIDKNLVSDAERSFGSYGNALSKAWATATGNRLKQVTVSLRDMRVVTMTHQDLLRLSRDVLKDDCDRAVTDYLQAGVKVCQTAEVLQADVAYRMAFADGLKLTEQVELTEEFQAKVNLGAAASGREEVRGDDLFFGVKLRPNCYTLNTPQLAAKS